jgi:AAA+ superfamily predicted ATPase
MTEPYPDDRAYVRDELARLDCRLRIEVERFDGPIDEFGALYISEAEVRRLLSRDTADGAGQPESAERQRLAERTREVRDRRRETADAGDPLRMDRLVDRFGLDSVERDVLVRALAPDVDEKYATVYAYLQDDATRRRPTVGFLVGLLGPDVDQLEARSLFTADAPLVDAGVLALEGDGPLPTRSVRVDPRIVAYLLGEDAHDPALEDLATVSEPDRGLGALDVAPPHRRALDELADPDPKAAPRAVVIHGPSGTRKAARVAALCGERREPLVTLDASQVPAEAFAETLDRVRREARLRAAAVHVVGVLGDETAAETAIRRLDGLDTAIYLTGETPPSTGVRTATSRHELVPIEVERADYDARRRYWAARDDLPADVDPAVIASTFRLSRGDVDDVMEMARATARGAGEPLAASHVYEACRAGSSEALTDFASRVDPSYDWDDIVLPAETRDHLREVADRLTNRGTVYADWGFAERASLGNGTVALFSGPSGTGKTMAAEVVAGHAGLDLYKIDLAAVVSKYVGETESNLGRIFDEATDSDAVLLFDEADALFGERSDVSDAHDRYANIEVDYLLQRIEEHDGAVVLTTNLESNIDDAFVRRIHLSVEFPRPDRAARAEIWRRVFPEDTPVDDLDYDYLARLDLTGGNIRNIALTAAFYAADRGTDVRMEDVVRAIQRECQKIGMPIQPDQFGEYRDIIEPR